MIKTEERIYEICEQLTDLDREGMEFILKIAEKIPEIAARRDRDVFINCICNKEDAVTAVAYAHCEHTVYLESTLGVFVYETDEPAVFRSIRMGRTTKDVYAISFTSTEGNLIIQEVYPIHYKRQVVGALIIEQGINASTRESIADIWTEPNIDKYPYLENIGVIGECIEEGVLILNSAREVIYRNIKMAKIYEYYGYVHDILGKKYDDITFSGLVKAGKGIENASNSYNVKCRDKYYRVNEYCYYQNEYYYIIMMSDITDDRKKEQAIVLKSDALREAHHRVKNNLQTVYSLLYMQKRRLNNPEAASMLGDAMTRIVSIASSYESLLSNKSGLDEISLHKVIMDMMSKIEQIEGNRVCDIDVNIAGEDFNIDADISTDIALVVNEIVQNSYKYAFVNREKGTISIRLSKRQIYGEVSIIDDGIGFDEKATGNQQHGLGLQIVKSIIEGKLKGHLKYSSDSRGTKVFFDFRTYKDYGSM